jgi:hypothetical protein
LKENSQRNKITSASRIPLPMSRGDPGGIQIIDRLTPALSLLRGRGNPFPLEFSHA